MATKKKPGSWTAIPQKVIARYEPKDDTLASELAVLSGMNPELAERIAKDGDWSADAGDLARKYGLTQMDAEVVLGVLNVNRGGKG